MKRKEVAVAGVAVMVVAALVAVDATFNHYLNGAAWFSTGSNLIQFASGPGLLIGIAMGAWLRWHRSCAVPWCMRLGEHPVKGTLRKTCTHHHTREHHELVHNLHAEDRQAAGRLGWGESHDREASDGRAPAAR